MKGLTVCQPWAWAIAAGHKLVENRTRRTSYRGPLAIHAGKSKDWLKRMSPETDLILGRLGLPDDEDLVFGAIVATAQLVEVAHIDEIEEPSIFAIGPWCWMLRDVAMVDPPIPWRGVQGIWEAKGLERILEAGRQLR